MKKLSLKQQLISMFLIFSLVPLMLMGMFAYSNFAKTLEQEATEKLHGIKELKSTSIKKYFEFIQEQLLSFAHTDLIADAAVEFKQAFHGYPQE